MARMVNVSAKPVMTREAIAEGSIKLKKETINAIRKKMLDKGDPVEIAKIAGIMAAKRTPEFIPLCHNIPIESVEIDVLEIDDGLKVVSHIIGQAKTGVEMEALTSVTAALLSIWDVVKKYEKDPRGQYPHTSITGIRVIKKVKIE